MESFLIAVGLALLLIVVPVFAYWIVAEYRLGRRLADYYFNNRGRTFPDKPNPLETRSMARKEH
ncbi:MAG: hypothetical protein HXY40_19045 [Chloroflexi bacterium]|nr:hypothetical protein [Chloroflexota bacterium]